MAKSEIKETLSIAAACILSLGIIASGTYWFILRISHRHQIIGLAQKLPIIRLNRRTFLIL